MAHQKLAVALTSLLCEKDSLDLAHLAVPPRYRGRAGVQKAVAAALPKALAAAGLSIVPAVVGREALCKHDLAERERDVSQCLADMERAKAELDNAPTPKKGADKSEVNAHRAVKYKFTRAKARYDNAVERRNATEAELSDAESAPVLDEAEEAEEAELAEPQSAF